MTHMQFCLHIQSAYWLAERSGFTGFASVLAPFVIGTAALAAYFYTL